MIRRALNITLVLVWMFFIIWLLTFGKSDLIRLLHPRLWWILHLAVIVLAFFLLSLIFLDSSTKIERPILVELPGMLILLVPLFYFTLAAQARLDGTSLQNRIIEGDQGVYLNNLPPFELFDESQFADMSFSRILRNPIDFVGKQVEVVCRSLVNDQLPENVAMCYRYVITCCAADALPAFIFLSHHAKMNMENDRWVQIRGPLSIIRNSGMEFPSVDIEALEYVEEPAFPWAM